MQCFPEPLQFNKENSVFELVSEEKKLLAERIKKAYREHKRSEQKRKKRIIFGSCKTIVTLEPIPSLAPSIIDPSFTVKVSVNLFVRSCMQNS